MRWLAILVLVGCTAPIPLGNDTGSTCPPIDPPTYATFGAPFFEGYCLACHTQTKHGADRSGAPETIDFDTRSLVRANTSTIDKQAAFGPAAQNRLMPIKGHPSPSDDERVLLGQYIACEIGR